MISKLLFSIFDVSLFRFSPIDKRHISLIIFSFPLWWNLLYFKAYFVLENAPSAWIVLFILSPIPRSDIMFFKASSLYFWNVSAIYIPLVFCPSLFQSKHLWTFVVVTYPLFLFLYLSLHIMNSCPHVKCICLVFHPWGILFLNHTCMIFYFSW